MNKNKVIIFFNRKGGCGKTSLAFGYYCYITENATKKIKKTLVFNTDPSSDSFTSLLINLKGREVFVESAEPAEVVGMIKVYIEKLYVKKDYTYIVDLQGTTVNPEIIKKFEHFLPVWIIPLVPCDTAQKGCLNSLADLIEIGVSVKRIMTIINYYKEKLCDDIANEYEEIIKSKNFVCPTRNNEILPCFFCPSLSTRSTKTISLASGTNSRESIIAMSKEIEKIYQ